MMGAGQMKKIAVIGVYGEGSDFTTGQAVKCHVVIDWLKKTYGPENVLIVNTYQWKKNPVGMAVRTYRGFKGCRNVIMMPAQNGLQVFAPLCSLLNIVFRRKLHYIVIGGWLADVTEKKTGMRRVLASFSTIQVEMRSLKNRLEAQGLRNIHYMPNCREYQETERRWDEARKPFLVCTFSRVIEEKGIEDAALICERGNELLGEEVFFLDVYGKISGSYEGRFQKFVRTHSHTVAYRGVKPAEEAVDTLSRYSALLFPTFYEGEGFAGTILDGFAAGIPILANDWKYNGEVIQSGINGFLYPFRDIDAAARILVEIYQNPELRERLWKGCRESLRRFSTEHVMGRFLRYLD